MGAGASSTTLLPLSRPSDLLAAEVRRVDAEAATCDERLASADLLLRFLPVTVCGALAAGLALDFYLHESPTHIKRHMLRTLRSSRPPATLPPAPALMLPVPQRPLPLDFAVQLLLGPPGCGKSTLLGFPLRRSLIGGALSRGFTLWGERMQAELSTTETTDRLVLALHILFEVCEELKLERQKIMPPLDAAPVLLFDEVQDLIKDARLARAGGRMVLSLLGALLVNYCVDRRAVRAVVTGSSAELYFAFEECSPLRGARWDCYTLPDPEVRATSTALVARGYSEEEVRGIVGLCGTRLRLLGGPLAFGAAVLSFDEFLRSAAALGSAAFASAFHGLSHADAAALGRLLDSIETCEAAAEGTGGRSADAARPTKKMLTGGLQLLDISPILYVDRNRELSFHSLLHRRTWARLRSKYVAPAPAGQ